MGCGASRVAETHAPTAASVPHVGDPKSVVVPVTSLVAGMPAACVLSAPTTARAEAVDLAVNDESADDIINNNMREQHTSGIATTRSGSGSDAADDSTTRQPTRQSLGGGESTPIMQPATDPLTPSRRPSQVQSLTKPSMARPSSLSRHPSGTDAEVVAVLGSSGSPVGREPPPTRSRTFVRRSSFGGGLLAAADEQAWRQPRQAQEMIHQHVNEDPHVFRDHVAIYWRLENVPPPRLDRDTATPSKEAKERRVSVTTPTAVNTPGQSPLSRHQPNSLHASPATAPTAASPASYLGRPTIDVPASPSPPPVMLNRSPSPSSPIAMLLPDQVSIFLSLGPSSGAGDKIGSSEYRPSHSSIAYFPMLLPFHALNGGDPAFSVQVQVWQKRVRSSPSSALGGAITMTLLGYIDLTVPKMFAAFERRQGLLLKSPPASALGGQTPVPLKGTMLVVDYIQMYCHTTAAVTAAPSRWPQALCTPATDCLWRAQIHAIKLVVPRGCPHPNVGGSMSPANGALLLSLKDLTPAPALGACFLQIFRQQTTTAVTDQGGVAATSWQLVHTTEHLSLSRNPKFSEFQRPLADICAGAYDLPLLLQVVLSHDPIRSSTLARDMMADDSYPDPAASVTQAIRQQGFAVCSLAHTITRMRDLLAGKTKLKLHAAGAAPMPLSSGGFGSIVDDAIESSTFVVSEDGALPPPTLGHGTLTFNISQIFSSRASLESIARAKIADIGKTPETDGFDQVGIARSTAYLASMLPINKRSHHRSSSHMRGPSMGGDHSPASTGLGSVHGGPALQRSRTSISLVTGRHSSAAHASTSGMSTMLEKMGIASDAAHASSPSNTDRRGSFMRAGKQPPQQASTPTHATHAANTKDKRRSM